MINSTEELIHKYDKALNELWNSTSSLANKLLKGTIDFDITTAQCVLKYLSYIIDCVYTHHDEALVLYEKVNDKILKFNPLEGYFD